MLQAGGAACMLPDVVDPIDQETHMTERQKQHMGRSEGDDRDLTGRDKRADSARDADAANPKPDVERGTDEVPAPNEERAPRGHRDDMGAGR